MNNWTAGYVSEIDYTHGYYQELNPARIRLAFIANGLTFPEEGVACELGFGQGLSTNIHAAATSVSWWGTDFNPLQANFARECAQFTGAKLFDDSFEEFCSRSDLPEFDFIALHGIWSWISDANRLVIVDFIKRKLKVGGVLYISYNTLPGWSSSAPLRHLLTQHKESMTASGVGIIKQIDAALEFSERLMSTNPLWARANPSVIDRLKQIQPQNRQYLAHEYFNRDWHPMYFSQMAEHLQSAKLSFACSANYTDLIDALNLTADHQAIMREISDPVFRQTIRDFMINQQFRKDYWVKGARRLSVLQRSELLRAQSIILCTARSDISLKAKGSLGEADMAEAVYTPILDTLSDYQARSLGNLEQTLSKRNISLAQIEQAVLLLIGQGHVSPVQESKKIEVNRSKAKKFNEFLLDLARGSGDINYLASPVTGGAIGVNRFNQLFLMAQSKGKKSPEEWAKFAWDLLASQGQKIVKDGKTLDSIEDNLAELSHQASSFKDKFIPVLKGLQVV